MAATNVAVGWRLNVPNGFFLNWSLEPGVGNDYEFVLVLVAAIVCVMLAGPGIFLVDRYRVRVSATLKLSKARLKAEKLQD